ncbi:cadmium-translocating P-type ATPase [Segatella oulorum F0390]|uniref:P-type Zn(2+) transporter n=1 Tax=Segatella oulorum F0390 TaxID=702438 RepID=G1WA77_9BACT|nr:heavy metal translocating P-type ATPase [Segatella oulorum]EGV33570.1 cadmium-translocating P-type ATPase [Segatella oulorum F0390]
MERKKIIQLIISAVLLAAAMTIEHMLSLPMWQLLLIYLPAYLLAGYETLAEAWEGIIEREPFNEDLLMSVATLGALLIGFLPGGEPEMAEAVFVMLFFQVGELFEDYAEGQSRRSISALINLRPDEAHVERAGQLLTVVPTDVAVGELMVVQPGEKVALDGVVVEGSSTLNTVALTGESMPRSVAMGDAIFSGCINREGLLRVKVTKPFGESTVSKIIALVERAAANKSKRETFIARFAKIYTPIVVYLALALAVLPPLLSGDFAGSFPLWLNRALTFLVVSCPCALVLSIPLTFFGGIGGASRQGILIKGGNYIDALAKAATVVFDKTGTLTRGVFSVTAVHPADLSEHELLHLAAHVERFSTHPIAQSLREAFGNEADGCTVEQTEEIAGQGIRARVNGKLVCVGNTKLMDSVGAHWRACHLTGTIIHVAVEGVYMGHIVIADELKPDAAATIAQLKAMGVQQTVMLTGDRHDVGQQVARELHIDQVAAELMPADKVAHVEQLMCQKRADGSLLFVGDGINDAPVLARADVGIAMGGLGSDAAIEAADVVLMDDKPSKVVRAISLARQIIAIAHQNVAFAIGVKVAVLVLATFGWASMWMAVFADVGVTCLAVLNAMRTLRLKG